MTNLAPQQTMYQPTKRAMIAPFKEWPNINDLKAKIIDELNHIPDENLLEFYNFILYFRLGLERLTELEDEKQWTKSFAESEDILAQLADEALAEYQAGKTELLQAEKL